MKNLTMTAVAVALAAAACATAPDTPREEATLQTKADTAIDMMVQRDPSLPALLSRAAGYAVFPEIGKGGFIAGGAHGQGVLYQGGKRTGYVELSQASFGAQIGAQTFAELVVLERASDVENIRSGEYSLGANASAVVLTSGAGAATTFADGAAVFILPRGGAMAELSVSGQRIRGSGSLGG